jgi:hypothetical protein
MDPTRFQITRRRFAFWLGFGLFQLSEALGADGLDGLAAAAMKATEPTNQPDGKSVPEHWTLAENNDWRWFEREHLIDGRWKLTGITTPMHRRSGEKLTREGYLDESLVPPAMRHGEVEVAEVPERGAVEEDAGEASTSRRARHGRPPSRWLRSLKADELRIWLKTIDVPEAGVSGMTFWEHLTRDHYFSAARITGLSEDEQAKLHSAAHYGY